MSTRNTALAGLAAAGLALLVPLVFGVLTPGYDQIADYISELGAVDAPYAEFVNFLGFVPIGLLVATFLVGLRSMLPPGKQALLGLILLSGISVAYVGAALFPCDAGCPSLGSAQQQVHNSLGVIEYIGAAAGLALLARGFQSDTAWRRLQTPTWLASLAVVAGFILMSNPDLAAMRGLAQRLAEVAIFGWIVLVSVTINALRPHR